MKYMNNHYENNRIPMNLQFFAEPDDSGENSTDICDGDIDSKPTYEQLIEELAKSRAGEAQANADREKFKNSIVELTRKNDELAKQVKERMTADEQLEAAKAEAEAAKDARIKELENEFRKINYSKRYMGIGIDETTATELSSLTGEIAEPDKFFLALDKFIKSAVKKAGEDSVQTLIKNNPSIKAGNGAEDENALGEERAVMAARRNSGANMDILKHYGYGGKN